ncbi:hypothetical protein [Marinicella gelatinilytica]|uniref:hypothetical protein n=1 Tax=Marinicella gelatinilytica TaxID=2996017 RepID=UPI002260AEDE|nr:hypothetical protein [Marinicella gelatinilytica]MCX7543807.1 hypothetical protein [Marinicella gelatinilytica]
MSKNHRTEIDKAIKHLMDFQQKEPYINDFQILESQLWQEVGEFIGEDPMDFRQWLYAESGMGHMAFGFLFERWGSVIWGEGDQTPIEIFLKNRGWREAPAGRQYLKKLNDAAVKIYEVTDVKPGEYIVVRDIDQPDKKIKVIEKKGSENIVPWTYLAGRVIHMRGQCMFTGAFLPLSHQAVENIKDRLEYTKKDGLTFLKQAMESEDIHLLPDMKAALMAEIEGNLADYVFVDWVMDMMDKTSPEQPIVTNRDGDIVEDMTLRFTIAVKPKTIKKYLDESDQLMPEPNQDDCWLWLDRAAHEHDQQVPIWGVLTLGEQDLTIRVNSRGRANKAKKYLKSLLGTRIKQPMMVYNNDQKTQNTQNTGIEDVMSDDISPEDRLAIIKDYMIQHYKDTLDQPIPMLDNLTPRVCAKNPKKRHKVIAWYKEIVSRSEKFQPGSAEDLAFILDELNISPEEL